MEMRWLNMNKDIIKKVKAAVLISVVLGALFLDLIGDLNNSGAGCQVANNLP